MKSLMATTSSDTTEAKANITFAALPSYYLHDITMDGKNAGARPPITTDAAGEFAGCYISINVSLNKLQQTGKASSQKER